MVVRPEQPVCVVAAWNDQVPFCDVLTAFEVELQACFAETTKVVVAAARMVASTSAFRRRRLRCCDANGEVDIWNLQLAMLTLAFLITSREERINCCKSSRISAGRINTYIGHRSTSGSRGAGRIMSREFPHRCGITRPFRAQSRLRTRAAMGRTAQCGEASRGGADVCAARVNRPFELLATEPVTVFFDWWGASPAGA